MLLPVGPMYVGVSPYSGWTESLGFSAFSMNLRAKGMGSRRLNSLPLITASTFFTSFLFEFSNY